MGLWYLKTYILRSLAYSFRKNMFWPKGGIISILLSLLINWERYVVTEFVIHKYIYQRIFNIGILSEREASVRPSDKRYVDEIELSRRRPGLVWRTRKSESVKSDQLGQDICTAICILAYLLHNFKFQMIMKKPKNGETKTKTFLCWYSVFQKCL